MPDASRRVKVGAAIPRRKTLLGGPPMCGALREGRTRYLVNELVSQSELEPQRDKERARGEARAPETSGSALRYARARAAFLPLFLAGAAFRATFPFFSAFAALFLAGTAFLAFSTACAAASRAMGSRYGEQET